MGRPHDDGAKRYAHNSVNNANKTTHHAGSAPCPSTIRSPTKTMTKYGNQTTSTHAAHTPNTPKTQPTYEQATADATTNAATANPNKDSAHQPDNGSNSKG